MGKYLDQNGLRYFWQKVKSEIQKSSGVTPSAVLDLVYPIGSIFEWCDNGITAGVDLSTEAKVNDHLGGQWERFGDGRVLVAFSANDPSFNSNGKTGGEKTHTLSDGELPTISGQFACAVPGNHSSYASGAFYGVNFDSSTNSPTQASGQYGPIFGFGMRFGSGQSHNNLQPYVVVYRYRRIG